MNKYLVVFANSWQNELHYRFDLVIKRLRTTLRFLMIYFLWNAIFLNHNVIYGYTKNEMFTYVFLVLVMQTVTLASPSSDNVGGEISNGDVSNYLVKPVNYTNYWLSRDLSSKLLNLFFAFFEITLLWFILKPQIIIQSNLFLVFAFILSCVCSILIYYYFSITVRFIAFWTPENTWAAAFLTLVFLETLSGSIFPLDILPNNIVTLLQFTPFPYIIYYPIEIYLGKITGFELLKILSQSTAWSAILLFITKFTWRKGLEIYSSEGR